MEAQKRGLEDWKMNFLLTFGEDPQVTWGYPVDIKHGDQKSVDVLNIGNTCKDRFVSSYIWGIFERQECRCKACAFFSDAWFERQLCVRWQPQAARRAPNLPQRSFGLDGLSQTMLKSGWHYKRVSNQQPTARKQLKSSKTLDKYDDKILSSTVTN